MTNNRNRNRGGYHRPLIITLDVLLILLIPLLFYWNHLDEAKREKENQIVADEWNAKQEALNEELDNRAEKVKNAFTEYLPGIVCWGDSLTAGAGGDGTTYPLVLQSAIEENVLDAYDMDEPPVGSGSSSRQIIFSVVNMGVGGEGTKTILGRNGAIPFTVGEDFTIPSDTSSVKIKISGGSPLRQGSAGMGYVIIDGVKGVISIEQESSTSKEYTYYFQREESGDETKVKAGTEIVTQGSLENLNYIPVIFIGQNGGYDDIDDLISQQRAIIEHQSGNPEGRFIIVGLHTGTAEERAELEEAMEAEYGDQYINLREYMSTQGLADAGLTPTEEDEEMMADGMTPASLMVSDKLHFNADGYELIGNLIYNRMNELGYFDEVNEAITEAMQPIQ